MIVAAPKSGSGKTVLTLGLMRALTRRGLRVAPAKVGPDYIDPAFHAAACGRASVNLDPWAMRPATLDRLAAELGGGRDGTPSDIVLVEGVMGLFDGAADGTGSTADLAARAGWPVLLTLDVTGQGASAMAVIDGFARYRADISFAGVVLNRVGSARHRALIEGAGARGAAPGVPADSPPILGALMRNEGLALPARHLGLVQASETADLDTFLERAADAVEAGVDLDRLVDAARPAHLAPSSPASMDAAWGAPPGRRIAVARDAAFAFVYPHLLAEWRAVGAEILPFSPLDGQGPDAGADAVYLPGGYPELHGARIAGNAAFLDGLRAAAGRGAAIFGECGGYMVLGERIVDGDGRGHAMAGLLPLVTSFAERRLHLGYRRAAALSPCAPAAAGARLSGHEFHYATTLHEGPGDPLFHLWDAGGADLGTAGLARGTVAGSFLHIVDRA
nr:cobyrinate a,c-diamide synthase [Marivibrio halodurans]